MKLVNAVLPTLFFTVRAFRPTPCLTRAPSRLSYKDKDGIEAKLTTAEPAESLVSAKNTKSIDETITRLTKPRPYPLFMAEKVAGVVDGVIHDISQIPKAFTVGEDVSETTKTKTKQRIVILGVGWGAAALLKSLDPDMYDVSVVSPRNHFIFTPLLSGSCVGTVEFRSICEPVREVSVL